MEILKHRIISVEKPADDIRIIRFAPLEKAIEYKPGHFVMLHAMDEKGETIVQRPYSIASSPHQKYMEFCIKITGGKLTSILVNAKVGDVYGISEPMGHFVYDGQERCAFVAGGTGIAPFMSMLRWIDHKKTSGSFVLFYSSRKRDLILYRNELEKLCSKNRIKMVITLTREEPEGWDGERGRINGRMLERHVKQLADYSWYICGPLEMTTELRNYLIEKGVKSESILFEGWG